LAHINQSFKGYLGVSLREEGNEKRLYSIQRTERGEMMKKIVILLLMVLSINLSGLDVLSAEFGLELGWLPKGTLNMYEQASNQVWYQDEYYRITEVQQYDLSNTFYTVLATRIYFLEYCFCGGSMDVSMHCVGKTFDTEGICYMFEIGAKKGMVEIFYKHNCIHPAPAYLYRYLFSGKWEVAHDRIGIKISGKIGR